jgi:hypothetical protein
MKWALLMIFLGNNAVGTPAIYDTQLRFHSWEICVKEADNQLGDVQDNMKALHRQRGSHYRAYRQSNWSCVPVKK